MPVSDHTTRFQLPLLSAGQAQKEVFHNEALMRIDALSSPAVEGEALPEPPAAPEAGQAWIVAADATGAWSGADGAVAAWTDGGWRFVPAVDGMLVWRRDKGHWIVRAGGSWVGTAFPVSALSVEGTVVVGPQQPAVALPTGGAVIDAEARTALGAIVAALNAHGLIAA